MSGFKGQRHADVMARRLPLDDTKPSASMPIWPQSLLSLFQFALLILFDQCYLNKNRAIFDRDNLTPREFNDD
jgi:hypothetical protein